MDTSRLACCRGETTAVDENGSAQPPAEEAQADGEVFQDDAADFLSTEDNDIESNGEEQTWQTVAPTPAKQRSSERELARQKKDDDAALEHAIGRALAEKLAN